MIRSRMLLATIISLHAFGGSTLSAAQRLVDVREIATDTLRDVALVAYDLGRPVIYYNPVLMQRIGPQLTAFFMAHEYGHVAYGHSGAALTLGGDDAGVRRQRQELEADCYATETLAERNPESVAAALQFFTRLGPFRFDNLHPTGAQRAAKILACLPPGAHLPAPGTLPVGWAAYRSPPATAPTQ
jgi:hypothetical protein